jgi:16S rRNA (guanine527-N7)-methyltransferase
MLASADAEAKLSAFAGLLLAWNARINLIGRGDEAVLSSRHVADSLAVLPLMPPGVRRIVDFGSGGGLPGLPVAIASGIETHLVDRDRRKCAFLREAGWRSGAPVVVHEADFMRLPPLKADLVLCRATAALPALLDAASRHARKGGTMLFHKSDSQAAEITAARQRWKFTLQILETSSDTRGRLWRLSDLARRDG